MTFVSATDKQLGGYVVEYDRMTFAIVHGAGHLVPGERPWHALDLLSTFLAGGSLAA
jgi:serine carboxypeptidase-like clade 2